MKRAPRTPAATKKQVRKRPGGKDDNLKIFLASSTEAAPILKRVATWIRKTGRGHTPRPWTDPGMFVPGVSVWTDLHRIAGEVDAAIAIFASDDAVKFRSRNVAQARDNALVEYGLFAGKLGPGRTAFCAQRGVKVPSDVRGIGFIELPAKGAAPSEVRRRNQLALKKIDLWLQHVEKVALATPTPLSKGELEKRIRTAEDVLIESIFDPRRGGDADTINAFAGDLLVRDTVRSIIPERMTSDVELRIQRNGDGVCSMRERLKFSGREVSLCPFTMGGDSEVRDVQDLQVSVRSMTQGITARGMIAESTPNKHVALLGFRPAVPAGKDISYLVSWRWPGMWEKFIKGEEDVWTQSIESTQPPLVKFRVLVDKRLGKPTLVNRGDGRLIQRSGVRASNGFWEYQMTLRDLRPVSSIRLCLLPK